MSKQSGLGILLSSCLWMQL